MKPYTLTIRFRETDEYEAEVGAFMKNLSKHTDKSKNRFIIDLIGDYMKRSEQEQQETLEQTALPGITEEAETGDLQEKHEAKEEDEEENALSRALDFMSILLKDE